MNYKYIYMRVCILIKKKLLLFFIDFLLILFIISEITDTDLKSSADKDKTDSSSSGNNKNNDHNDKDNATSTAAKTDDDTIKEVSKESSGFKYTPIVFNKTSNDSNEKTGLSDAEKKMERAKRFGIDVNETTKQELRAKRFGISKPTTSNNDNNNSNKNIQPGNKKQFNRNRPQKPQSAAKVFSFKN